MTTDEILAQIATVLPDDTVSIDAARTPAPSGLCENCDADDRTKCGCCPACDTTLDERCAACDGCRCDTHPNCQRT